MSNITVKFLGKEYSIPEDALAYIELLDFTDSIQKQLFGAFVRKLKNEIAKDNIGLLGDEDLTAEIEQQVGRFIAKLCDNGIFTRTISDYLTNNKGYQLISEVNKAALNKMKSLLIQEMEDWKAGYENAVNNAESHVTGMGFSIWSSSFVNHAIYAAMESSKLKEQSKEAEAQYQKDMSDLRSRLDSQYGGEKSNYINNTYIPSMEAAITVFVYELLDKYISDLIANDKFDGKTLDYVDIGRSNDLLKNLTLSNNKQAILENAFTACPYNIAVYMQAMKYDLLDYDSFQTAKVFKQDHLILSFLHENCGEVSFPTKFNINYHCINLLALFTGKNSVEILHELTAQYTAGIIKSYGRVVNNIGKSDVATKVMGVCSESAILAGNVISQSQVKAYVSEIVSERIWSELTEKCGYADLLKRIKEQVPGSELLTTKRDVDLLLEGKLYPTFEEARQIRETEIIKKREDDAKKKEAEAEKARCIAKRNKIIKISCLVAVAIAIVITIVSLIVNKINNTRAYQEMAGEFCVYRVIDDDGEERNEFNWWLSIDEDGTIKMSSWSYAYDNTVVNSYSGTIKNNANFRKFEDYRIEDYCADVSKYKKALYSYEFHVADEWEEFDGYIVCWQYYNGKIIDIYCDDYRYSFVETNDDYNFYKWEKEINSDELSKNVQKLIDNIDVSEEDSIEQIESKINKGDYDGAITAISSSKLPDEQKNAYYESLVTRTNFRSFDVNGLICHIPGQWIIRENSNPNIMDAVSSDEELYAGLWVKYMGAIEEVEEYGDANWKTRNKLSETTIPGCTSAYVRYKNDNHGKYDKYYVIDHYVECDGRIFQIQYLAYGDRYFEEEARLLLEQVEFINYSKNRAEIQEQKYTQAINLFTEGKYEEALLIFMNLEGYKDSNQKMTECNNAISEEKYNTALTLASNSKYKEALALLDELGDYKDAIELRKKYKLISCESGDVITFGTYEQDGNLTNGTEDIEWIVIARDGNKALVMSKYCLEQMPFNSTLASVTWKNSTIRTWLNSDFYNNAFSSEERSKIFNTTFATDGVETTDKVFLLDEEDASFLPLSMRKAKATDHVSTTHCYWFLRNTGSASNAAYVSYDGELGYYENVDREWWIRPVMWIDVSE